MMNKQYILNAFLSIFMLAGLYHLPACTVLVDVTTGQQTETSSGGQTTSLETSTGDSQITTEQEMSLCGNCNLDPFEECDFCSYETKFMSKCDNTLTGMCTLLYAPNPQMDCTNSWVGNIGCDQEEADLYCKMLVRNNKAKAKDGAFKVGSYIQTRGLWSPQLVTKDGVELHSIPEDIFPQVFYFEQNPYLVPIMTLELNDDGCFIDG